MGLLYNDSSTRSAISRSSSPVNCERVLKNQNPEVCMDEYLIVNSKLPDTGVMVDCAVLVHDKGTIIGKEPVLEAIPSKSERFVLDAKGGMIMPMLYDHLSFLSPNETESTLNRIKTAFFAGGSYGGCILPERTISRVSWLDFGRRIKRTFGDGWQLGGNKGQVARWTRLIGKELPNIAIVEPYRFNMQTQEFQVCLAQEHRKQENIHFYTPFAYSFDMFPLITEEQKGNETLQETINRMYNEAVEVQAVIDVLGSGHQIRGTTMKHYNPDPLTFLMSLIVDTKNSSSTANIIPVRSPKIRLNLLSEFSQTSGLLCLGHGRQRDSELQLGHEIAAFALPLLLDALSPFYSWFEIYKLLTKKTVQQSAPKPPIKSSVDNSIKSVLNSSGRLQVPEAISFNPPDFRLPKSFVVLRKKTSPEKASNELLDVELPSGIPPPSLEVSLAVHGNRLVYQL